MISIKKNSTHVFTGLRSEQIRRSLSIDEGVIVGTVARVNSQQEIRGVSLHSSLALVLGNKSPALKRN